MTATSCAEHPADCSRCEEVGRVGDDLVDAILTHRRAVSDAAARGLSRGDAFYERSVYLAWHARNDAEEALRALAGHPYRPPNVIDINLHRHRTAP